MISFIFWHILVPIKILFRVNFEKNLITGLKDIEFRFFAHNFFKNGLNSIFFLIFVFFTYFLEKNTKKLFDVFLYAIFEFENFNLVFETVCRYSWIFLIIFYFELLFILQILRPGRLWSYDNNYYYFSIFDFWFWFSFNKLKY